MRPEIIIRNPQINTDSHAGWSYGDPLLTRGLREGLARAKVTAATHPRLVDLCSGKGGVADIFVDLGWDPKNITCIDRAVPKRSFVEDAEWKYWDLAELGRNLRHGRSIPLEVLKFQHTFDVVTLFLGFIGNEDVLCNFLVREGGIVFGPPKRDIRDNGIARHVVWQF